MSTFEIIKLIYSKSTPDSCTAEKSQSIFSKICISKISTYKHIDKIRETENNLQ